MIRFGCIRTTPPPGPFRAGGWISPCGRGSSIDSFPLFGYEVAHYDQLFADKLDLLLEINRSDQVTWSGPTRPDLDHALVVPRVPGGLKIWLGTGGNPGSCVRAGVLGLPLAFGILGGTTEEWVHRADIYRQAAHQSGHGDQGLDIAVRQSRLRGWRRA